MPSFIVIRHHSFIPIIIIDYPFQLIFIYSKEHLQEVILLSTMAITITIISRIGVIILGKDFVSKITIITFFITIEKG